MPFKWPIGVKLLLALFIAAGCLESIGLHEVAHAERLMATERPERPVKMDASEEETGIDDEILDGFIEDETGAESAAHATSGSAYSLPKAFWGGDLKLSTSYLWDHEPEGGEIDWHGLARVRPEINLYLSAKFNRDWRGYFGVKGFYDLAYTLRGRDEFTEEVLDKYEKEAEFTEVYVQGRVARGLDLKIGRQIVVWGRSDYIRVTDILNPIDNREPGYTDIEDLRLPVTMTKLDFFVNSWTLTALAIHETRFNKIPTFGHYFYPYEYRLPPEEENLPNFDNPQWAAALNGIFSQKDFSLYWGNLLNSDAHIESIGSPPRFARRHERVQFYGGAFNIASGNWLFKSEGAILQGVKFANTGDEEFMRSSMLVGFEYSGFDDTFISADISVFNIHDFKEILETRPDYAQETQWRSAFSVSRDFFYQSLNVQLLALIFGEKAQDGAMYRLTGGYDITDAWNLRVGVALYESGDLYTLRSIGDNDQIFAELKYSFMVSKRKKGVPK